MEILNRLIDWWMGIDARTLAITLVVIGLCAVVALLYSGLCINSDWDDWEDDYFRKGGDSD